ncbi:Uncharacterized protein Adt_22231 [Abeliophyllum distichum]|uniref:Uncharacterized protein n=1 Tax=Abeliophyllum distichum TaxID=126358 RepID=A0ABD1T1L6_9LAMI
MMGLRLRIKKHQNAGSKMGVEGISRPVPKSPSVSQTLGDCDTESESSSEKCHSVNDGINILNVADPTKKKAPWVSLFSDNRKPPDCLKLPVFENLPEKLIFKYEDVEDVETAWRYCLIGY